MPQFTTKFETAAYHQHINIHQHTAHIGKLSKHQSPTNDCHRHAQVYMYPYALHCTLRIRPLSITLLSNLTKPIRKLAPRYRRDIIGTNTRVKGFDCLMLNFYAESPYNEDPCTLVIVLYLNRSLLIIFMQNSPVSNLPLTKHGVD